MSQEKSTNSEKKKSKKSRLTVFLTVLVVLIAGVAAFFLAEKFFVVKDVSVMKSEIYDTQEIAKCAAIKKGTPLYKIDKSKVIDNLQKKFPYLEDVKITGKLPNKVQITFREEYGKFSLALGVELFALDDELFVLAKEDGSSEIERIEIITGDVDCCFVGESLTFIDEDTAPILRSLIKALKEKKMLEDILSIDVRNQFDIRLDYLGRFEIALGDHLDIPLKLSMVLKILEDLGPAEAGLIDISDSDQAYVKLKESLV